MRCETCEGHGWQHDLVETKLGDKHETLIRQVTSGDSPAELSDFLTSANASRLAEMFPWQHSETRVAGDAMTRAWSASVSETNLTVALLGETINSSFYGPAATTLSQENPFDKIVGIATSSDEKAIRSALEGRGDLASTLRSALDKPANLARLDDEDRAGEDSGPYKVALDRILKGKARAWNYKWLTALIVLTGAYYMRPNTFFGDWVIAAVAFFMLLSRWLSKWDDRQTEEVTRIVSGPNRNAVVVKAIIDRQRAHIPSRFASLILITLVPAMLAFMVGDGLHKRKLEKQAAAQAEEDRLMEIWRNSNSRGR